MLSLTLPMRVFLIAVTCSLLLSPVAAWPVAAQDEVPTAAACNPFSGDAATRTASGEASASDVACATAAAAVQAAIATRPATGAGTIEPSEEPSAPADESQPTGEVAVELPPADFPSTNEQGYTYALEASLTAEFSAVPLDSPVYRIEAEVPTEEEVSELVASLDITGAVESRGGDVFVASGDGDLFVTPTLIQYLAPPVDESDEPLPSAGEATALARDWLQRTGLIEPDLGEGEIITQSTDAGRIFVQFRPIEPERILAAYPSIVVTLGPGGATLEARVQWPTVSVYDLYRLRDAESAWRDVESGRAYIEAPLEDSGIEPASLVEGTVTYDRIDIGYTTSGLPGGDQFLQPVFIFSGEVVPSGAEVPYPISAYVPALPDSGAPVG